MNLLDLTPDEGPTSSPNLIDKSRTSGSALADSTIVTM